jgi:4-hydroxy-tetrahydrodipicolinate reductase
MLRILHVGLGPLGQRVALDLRERGLGRIVAAIDTSPALVGQDFHGVRVGRDVDEALDSSEVDCAIVTTSSDLAKCAPVFRSLLGRGCAVVSTCEELLWPWLRHGPLAREFDELARRAGGRLLGTGINPGFLMDTLPVFASAVCKSVERVDVWRIQDATTRRIPFQQKIGAALDDAAFEQKRRDGSLRHVGLGESIHFVAHYLGLSITRWEETLEPVRAERELESGVGKIAAGRPAGVRQVATAWDGGGATVARFEFVAAIGQRDPHDRVRIQGEPVVDAKLAGGVHGDVGTSAMVLNSIPSLLAAGPGLHTMATIPLAHHFSAPKAR